MSEEGNTRGARRYAALDIHKHYCIVAGVYRDGRVMLHAVRVEHADLEGWLKKNLHSTAHVVIESTTNAWQVYDLLAPFVERVLVSNPIKVKQIASARVKTDIRDTLILARLLAANLVPDVWVPPVHVRQLRQLLSQRRQFVETHTQIVNRMHSVAHRHHLRHPAGKRFNEKNTTWQKDKRLSQIEQFQLELEMENRVYIEKQIGRIGKEVAKMSHQKPWAQSMTYLMQLPGFGVITAMTVLAAIGEIQRFDSARHLASYSGLTPGLEQSGTKYREKGITKEGRKELRWALVEVAQRAVKSDPLWKHRFQELQKRMHRNQAIVAVAHRLVGRVESCTCYWLTKVGRCLNELSFRCYTRNGIVFAHWSKLAQGKRRIIMKKPVNLILSVLFVCMLASCVGATPKLVGPGGKIGDMTVQQHSANELMRDISIYCSEYRYMGFEPGTQTSDCDVPMVPSLQIGSSWEAKDPTILESNWSAMVWELHVDGYQIDLNEFELEPLNPTNMRGWTIDLVNLSPGKHTIRNLWRAEKSIDDGFNIYPPGTYESIVNFTVAEK